MDISLFLAQVFGLYLLIVGAAFLFNPKVVDEFIQEFSSSRAWIMFGGALALFIGVPLVLIHNVWDGSWRVVITVLVWLTLFKGVVRLFAPGAVVKWAESLKGKTALMRASTIVMMLVGAYLLYVGFGF